MVTNTELIEKYENELQEILTMFDVTEISKITLKPYQWRAGAINRFLVDLKNLPEHITKAESS